MKFIISILLIALLGFAAPLYLPWWAFAITSFIVAAVIPQKPSKSFAAGFIGLAALWIVCCITLDQPNQHVLATKVAYILPLGGSYGTLIVLTGFIGGLVSGFAALTGSYIRKV